MSFGFINTNKITLESFSSDVSPVEFINKISKLSDEKNDDTFIHTNNNKVRYIDPVPYISSLKSVQDKLLSLVEECDKKKEIFEKNTGQRERDHYQNVIDKSSTASNLKGEFNDLLLTVEKLHTSKIDPLGEKLRLANTLKDNSTNIIFLMKCYNHFYIHGKPPLELLADRKHANTIELATILSQLKKLADKLADDSQLPNAEKAKTLILEFATTFENDQLESFNTYYQSKNFQRLQNITKTLFVYNNGVNIVDFFVNSHPIFAQMKDNIRHDVGNSYWEELADPNSTHNMLDSVSIGLLETVRDTIISEIDSILTIFQENAKQALTSLVLKIVQDIIQPRLKFLVAVATTKSKLCYLKILHMFSNAVNQTTLLQLRSALLDKDIELFIFNKIYNSLFSKFTADNAYFRIEKENLESLIDVLIDPFEVANKDSLKEKKLTLKIEQAKQQEEDEDIHENVNRLSLREESNPYAETGPDSVLQNEQLPSRPQSADKNIDLYLPDSRILRDKVKNAKHFVPSSKRIKKITGITGFIKLNEKYSIFDRYKSSSSTSNAETNTLFKNSVPDAIVTDANKSVVSIQVTENIYKLVLESLTRSVELVPSQINTYTVELFKLLLYKIGPSYLALGLESLYDNYVDSQMKNKSVFNRSTNTDIDLSFLNQFYNIFVQVYLFSTVVKKSFYPLVSNEYDSALLSDSFNAFLQDVEIGINIILKDTIEIIKTRMNTILSKQPLTDYCVFSESDRTQTSELMTAFLEAVLHGALNELTFDPILKVRFISKISSYFLSLLISHLSHLKVTIDGFTLLTHDLAQYILIFNNIKIEETDTYNSYGTAECEEAEVSNKWVREQLDQIQSAFKILNEIPGLYTCQPESLKEFCKEGKLNDLKKQVIRDYISNREDFQPWFISNI